MMLKSHSSSEQESRSRLRHDQLGVILRRVGLVSQIFAEVHAQLLPEYEKTSNETRINEQLYWLDREESAMQEDTEVRSYYCIHLSLIHGDINRCKLAIRMSFRHEMPERTSADGMSLITVIFTHLRFLDSSSAHEVLLETHLVDIPRAAMKIDNLFSTELEKLRECYSKDFRQDSGLEGFTTQMYLVKKEPVLQPQNQALDFKCYYPEHWIPMFMKKGRVIADRLSGMGIEGAT